MSPSEIALRAEESNAYRYALRELNPFVIEGKEALYDVHNEGGALDRENFTDQYLQDRAEFLSALILRNVHDVLIDYIGAGEHGDTHHLKRTT